MDRRQFLKLGGAAALASGSSLVGTEARAGLPDPPRDLDKARQTTSICPYCAVGCGLVVSTEPKSGRIVHIEGDPDHPINEGALCAKGAALRQLVENPDRTTRVLYRAPGGDKWEAKPWDWALDRIAALVKRDRDASFVERDGQGRIVNRTEGLAHLGSAALDNEECWALQAVMRSWGLTRIEHQARI